MSEVLDENNGSLKIMALLGNTDQTAGKGVAT